MADENKQAIIDELRRRAGSDPDKLAIVDELQRRSPMTRVSTAEPESPKSDALSMAGSFLKGAVVNTAKGAVETVKELLPPELTGRTESSTDAALRTISPALPLAKKMLGANFEEGRKAFEALKRGGYSEAAGHGVAALLPGIGPAAASIGERAGDAAAEGDYNRVAEEVGNAAAITLPLVAPKVPAGTVQRVAGALKDSAKKSYSQVLNATTKGNKLRSAEVVPGLIERGTTAMTMKGLQEKSRGNIQSYGQAIDDAWTTLPVDAVVDAGQVLNRIAKVGEEAHTVAGPNGARVPIGPEGTRALGHLGDLQQTIASIAEDRAGVAVVPAAKLRQLRQYFDDISEKAGRFDGKNLADQSSGAAHGIAADAIRGELAAEFPNIATINKEYAFWKNVDKVVSDTILRREGQAKPLGRKLGEAAGAAAGYGSGGLAGAVVGKYALGTLEALTTSPAWRTASSVLKDRLADAIAKGDRGRAEFIINKMNAEVSAIQGQKKDK